MQLLNLSRLGLISSADEDEPQAEEDEAEADDEVMVTPPLKTNGSAVPAEEEDLLA